MAPASAAAAAPTAAAGEGAAAAAPAAVAPTHNPAAVAAAWKEHTAPDGRKYYHNRLTKESRWQMPEEYKAAKAAKLAKGGGSCRG